MGSASRLDHSSTHLNHLGQRTYMIRCCSANRLEISRTGKLFKTAAQYVHFQYQPSQGSDGVTISLQVEESFFAKSSILFSLGSKPLLVSDSFTGELLQGLLQSDHFSTAAPETIAYTVQMLCAHLTSCIEEVHASELRFEDWQAQEVADSLQEAVTSGLSTQEIANRCGLSTCHFSRLFKATYGMPVYQFIVQARIKEAQSRLLATADSITDIALDCGFSDQSSFTRRFTALTGTSPALWRKQTGMESPSSLLSSMSN